MARLLIILVLAGLLAGCAASMPTSTPTTDPCRVTETQKYLDVINGVARRYDDARTLAGSTPRMNLPPIIKDPQEVRRNTEDLVLPTCASKAKVALVAYMNADIEYLLAFLSTKSDAELKVFVDKTTSATKEYWVAAGELGVVPKP